MILLEGILITGQNLLWPMSLQTLFSVKEVRTPPPPLPHPVHPAPERRWVPDGASWAVTTPSWVFNDLNLHLLTSLTEVEKTGQVSKGKEMHFFF